MKLVEDMKLASEVLQEILKHRSGEELRGLLFMMLGQNNFDSEGNFSFEADCNSMPVYTEVNALTGIGWHNDDWTAVSLQSDLAKVKSDAYILHNREWLYCSDDGYTTNGFDWSYFDEEEDEGLLAAVQRLPQLAYGWSIRPTQMWFNLQGKR